MVDRSWAEQSSGSNIFNQRAPGNCVCREGEMTSVVGRKPDVAKWRDLFSVAWAAELLIILVLNRDANLSIVAAVIWNGFFEDFVFLQKLYLTALFTDSASCSLSTSCDKIPLV